MPETGISEKRSLAPSRRPSAGTRELPRTSVTVRPALASDAPAILALLRQENFIGDLTDEEFMRLFRYNWAGSPDNFGYVLVAGSEIVGTRSLIYSRRLLEGGWRPFCNYSTLYIRPEFRSRTINGERLSSVLIEAALRAHPGITATTFSAKGHHHVMHRIYGKLGYRLVGRKKLVYLPTYALSSHVFCSSRMAADKDEVQPLLTDEQLRIMRDHLPYGCGHYVLTSGRGTCFFVTKKRPVKLRALLPLLEAAKMGSRRLHCTEVLHISHPEVASACWPKVARFLMRHEASPALLVQDSILGPGAPKTASYPWPIFAKGPFANPGLVDQLYSEIVLLPL